VSAVPRMLVIAFLAAAAAAGPTAAPAGAAPTCTAAVDPAWVVQDPVVGWMVGTNLVSGACDPEWRVALSPQYQTADGLWHGGRRVFNHIYYPAANTYFAPGSAHVIDLACCILYWDNGDGTERFTPLCRHPWRIHAGFWTETAVGPVRFADAYSDPAPATCPPRRDSLTLRDYGIPGRPPAPRR
jgi:hypothetical protein